MATKQEDTVEFQLIERTLLHYFCFSDADLIDDALKDIAITDDKEKDEYKAQIKKNNEAHVIAALNQKIDDTYVISSLSSFKDRDDINDNMKTIIQQAMEAREAKGGKTKTKKVRKIRRQIGGDIKLDKLNKIHAHIATKCIDNINKYLFPTNTDVNRAGDNFKKAVVAYNQEVKSESEVKVKQEVVELQQKQSQVKPSNENIAAAVAAAYYYFKQQESDSLQTKNKNDAFKIANAIDDAIKDDKIFKLEDFPNNSLFSFTYNGMLYIYYNNALTKVADDISMQSMQAGKDITKDITIIKTDNPELQVESIVLNIIGQFPKKLKPNGNTHDYYIIQDEYALPTDTDNNFDNCIVAQAYGDGNCLIHAFLFLSKKYREINAKRKGFSPYHTYISILFRKFVSDKLTQNIFDEVKEIVDNKSNSVGVDLGLHPEFNNMTAYKKYMHDPDDMSKNMSHLSVYDAMILARMFNVHIDIIYYNDVLVSSGNDSKNRMVFVNKGGNHFDVVLRDTDEDKDKYTPFIPRKDSNGGRIRSIRKKQKNQKRKTYKK